jgi:hypothetical protein
MLKPQQKQMKKIFNLRIFQFCALRAKQRKMRSAPLTVDPPCI